MSIQELGMHGVKIGKTIVHVESDAIARKIRKTVAEYLKTNPTAGYKELIDVANLAYVG